jgi:hypothetical protein
MLGLICLAWLYLRKLKLQWRTKYRRKQWGVNEAMTLPSTNTRRWRRYRVDLPVQVIFRDGSHSIEVSGRSTELSRGGMALCAGLPLQTGAPIEVHFRTPSNLRVAGIIRNRTAHCFGLEFLSPLLS